MTAGLTVKLLKRIDAACDQFEEEWLAGRQPQLENYLVQATADERPALLHALSQVQQELLLRQFDAQEPDVVFAEAGSSLRADQRVRPESTRDMEPVAVSSLDNDARVELTVTAGPHQGKRFEFDRHETLLAGRSTRARLRLEDDPHFSRHHFRLEINPPLVHLIDLDSRNGTFINGERVSERTLVHGDVISGGKTALKVTIDCGARTLDVSLVPHQTIVPPRPIAPHASSRPTEICESAPPVRPAPSPIVPPRPAAATPPALPGYTMKECLGQIGLGVSYRAVRLATQEDCIVKVLETAPQTNPRSTQAFLREARVLGPLQHRHLVRLLDLGSADGVLYLATESFDVVPWDQVFGEATAEGRIRLSCGVACQILDGLQYAHTRSLVHRDIQPANILVVRDDRKYVAKLADFGLAKNYADAGFSQVTRTGDVVGTLAYMSPEQFMDSRHARPACDIYSLGATLYWLLAGRDPFPFDNGKCRFLTILEDEPIPLRKSFPQVPESLAKIVHRALAKDPSDRFASAAEMRHHLLPFGRRASSSS